MSSFRDSQDSQREGALLSWIQQFAPYGVITLDKTLRVQSWNHWMEIHSKLRFEEVAGKDILSLFPDLEERKLVRPFARALSGEASVLSTALHRYLLPLAPPQREPGVLYMLQTARIAPLLVGSEICGIVVVIEDVTQRETQATVLNRQHRRDEVLSWALAHFLTSEEPRKSIRPLFFKIAEHLDFDTFLLYIRDVESGALSLFTWGGIPPETEANFSRDTLLTRVADTNETVVFNAVQSCPGSEYATLKAAGVSAAVAIPLFFNERSLGLLCFGSWSRESISADESELLGTISQYLATAIDRENTNQQLRTAKHELVNHAQLLEKRVEERTEQLQETIAELETFSHTLAHDLKAPVRGLIGYCDVLLEDYAADLSPEVVELIQKLARTPQRMEALINDLLKFSEISRHEIVLSPTEIGPILEDLLSLRLPSVRAATTIRTPLHKLRANRALLQQVLSNLIDNAVKFIEQDTQPKITIFTEQVSATTLRTRSGSQLFNALEMRPSGAIPASVPPSQGIRLWVQDEGIGIPPEAHEKVFGVFERGVNAKLYEGTGMGLAIVARAMQRMGGNCGVESEPGKGSRFWIELPGA